MFVSRFCLGMMSYAALDATSTPWGAWTLDETAAEPIVKQAVEAGITFFDTADVYSAGGSEVVTGRLLPKFLSREEMVVATKFFGPVSPGPNGRGSSRKHILASIEGSLRRLNMDYVDLYQVHAWDQHTPLEETMEALNDIVRSGKARYLGACNLSGWQLAKANGIAERHGWAPLTSAQNHHNLLARDSEREVLPLCRHDGLAYLSWSSIARGWLSGKRLRGGVAEPTARSAGDALAERLYGRDADFDVIEVLLELAAERGVSPVQVALAWLLQLDGLTSPIVGLTKPGHLADVVASLEVTLDADEVNRLEAAYTPSPHGD
jgi:1-deoxyxylulose-5-phosphate synthase